MGNYVWMPPPKKKLIITPDRAWTIELFSRTAFLHLPDKACGIFVLAIVAATAAVAAALAAPPEIMTQFNRYIPCTGGRPKIHAVITIISEFSSKSELLKLRRGGSRPWRCREDAH